MVNGKKVAPRDPQPLKRNGPSNAKTFWDNQVKMQERGEYQTRYSNKKQFNPSDYKFTDMLNDGWTMASTRVKEEWVMIANALGGDLPNLRDFILNLYVKPFTSTNLATALGAIGLKFKYSDNDVTLHASPDRNFNQWQYHAGYMDLYDWGFKVGTDALRKKIYFDYGGETYILWCWKADYMNLGAGSEFGVYKRVPIDDIKTLLGNIPTSKIEFTMADKNRTMTNSLYYHNTNISNWQPVEKQWWCTNFNPQYKHPDDAKNLTMIGTVDFSSSQTDKEMYISFRNQIFKGSIKWDGDNAKAKAKEHLIFDDESHTVWIFWWGGE